MSNGSRHHFVPQFLLRQFATDDEERRVGVFVLSRDLFVGEASIRCQAQRARMYGTGKRERALSTIEAWAAAIIRDMARTRCVPKRGSRDHEALMTFVLLQHLRTPTALAETAEYFDQAADLFESFDSRFAEKASQLRVTPEQALALSMENLLQVPMAMDLGYKLLMNSAPTPFLISDHPVIAYNQFTERRRHPGSGTGLACKGLQLFLPISPTSCLVFYDYDVYRAGGRSLSGVQLQTTDADVASLNRLQAANAGDQLFFGRGWTDAMVRDLYRTAASFRRPARSRSSLLPPGVDAEGKKSVRVVGTKADLQIGLDLSSIKELPQAAGLYDPRVVQVRNPAIVAEAERRWQTRRRPPMPADQNPSA